MQWVWLFSVWLLTSDACCGCGFDIDIIFSRTPEASGCLSSGVSWGKEVKGAVTRERERKGHDKVKKKKIQTGTAEATCNNLVYLALLITVMRMDT